LIADTLNNCIRYGVPSLFSLTKVQVDTTIPVDSSLPPKPLYTSYFESNTRKYTYVENTTGIEVLNHPLPPRQPLPTDNTMERDGSISYTDSTLSIGGTNVVWQQWKDIDPISRTNGRAFYYAPSTFEVTWNLPSTSFPAYPPTQPPIADTNFPDSSYILKYLDPASGKNFYMNLLTKEYSWTPPKFTPLVPYPFGSTSIHCSCIGIPSISCKRSFFEQWSLRKEYYTGKDSTCACHNDS
jgi:hypothetical protein